MRFRFNFNSLTKLPAITSFFLIATIFSGCFDAPEEFIAPVWDVNLSIPLVNKNYTLGEAIEKDSGLIKSYPAGSPNANQLYFSDLRNIKSVEIGDKIKLDNSVSFERNENIGQISIKDPLPIEANLGLSWLSLTPGDVMAVPPISNMPADVHFSSTDQFNFIVLNSGSIDLTLTNVLPAPLNLTVSDISLNNDIDSKVVGSFSQPVTIPAGESKTINVMLNQGMHIHKNLGFKCKLSTPGSLSQVTLPQTSLGIKGKFRDLNITEAEGRLSENTIAYNSTFEIDDSTQYQLVKIQNGRLRISLENNIDAGVNIKFRLSNLYRNINAGDPFELNVRLEGKSNINLSRKTVETDLNGFVLRSSSLSNEIAYSVLAISDSTSHYVDIKSTDGIRSHVEMSELGFSNFNGRIKPTSISLTKTSISLNLGKWRDKFSFAKIRFSNPDIRLYVNPSSKIKARFNGVLSAPGTANKLAFSDDISKLDGQTDTLVTIPGSAVAEFFAGFTGKLPDSLFITGSAVLNPGYENQLYSVSSSDYLSGSAEIKLPLVVGISDGEFRDTTELDLKDSKSDLEKIKSVQVTMEITNGVPARLKYEGSLWDETMNIRMLTLPPAGGANGSSIDIPAAEVDSKGRVISPSVKREIIEITGSDVEKFLNSGNILSTIHINTSGATQGLPIPVEFKTNDAIRVKAFCRLVYRVE